MDYTRRAFFGLAAGGVVLAAGSRAFAQAKIKPGPQDLLLVAACADGASWAQILAAAERLDVPGTAAAAVERAGLVTIGPDRVRFRHPLVRSAVAGAATFTERSAAHLALAGAMTGDAHADRRTWHLAAAALGPDEEVAAQLEASAEQATNRSGYAAAKGAIPSMGRRMGPLRLTVVRGDLARHRNPRNGACKLAEKTHVAGLAT